MFKTKDRYKATLIIIFIIHLQVFAQEKQMQKPSINDHYSYISANQVMMWISNNGSGSHSPTGSGGFIWPNGKNGKISAIYTDGLVWGGIVNGEVRANGSTFRMGLQAGKILAKGSADDAKDFKYRVYKIKKDWEVLSPSPERDDYERDYMEWPIDDGAPFNYDVNDNKIPAFIGDETLWCVSNDLDSARTQRTFGSKPMGLEIHTSVFAFNKKNALGNMVFKKFKIINKSLDTIKNMYLGYWSDPDLGNANDDYIGCDTTLSLGYTYNADNVDNGGYGINPPAVGYDFLQGPIVKGNPNDRAKFDGKWKSGYKNLPMTSFITNFFSTQMPYYRDPVQGQYQGTLELYNYLQGKSWDGNPFIDPNTGDTTKFLLAGDPILRKGWYEGDGWPNGRYPGDRRLMMSSGPFNMAPSDTQEVVIGILIARGTDHLNSVAELKRLDRATQLIYDLDFNYLSPPEPPKVHILPQDRSVTLWWEPNAEKFELGDPFIFGSDIKDSTYSFEGYRIWQFKDSTGTQPKLLATFDIKNDVVEISDYLNANGVEVYVPVIKCPNEGLKRYITIKQNVYTNGPLYNGSSYYFAVTAFAYSKYSSPEYLESTPIIYEVRPQTPKVDFSTELIPNNDYSTIHKDGNGDGYVTFKVIDPNALTNHKYSVFITGTIDNPTWNLNDIAMGDTLLKNQNNFGNDSTYDKVIVDGMMVRVYNVGKDSSIILANGKIGSKIRKVVEVLNSGGNEKELDVLNNYNSTNRWKIEAYNYSGSNIAEAINLNREQNALDFHDYEIRFDDSSYFYLSGYNPISPLYKSDPIAKQKLPFSVWKIGKAGTVDSIDQRLSIKILDYSRNDSTLVRDSVWTRRVDGRWEPIFILSKPDYSSTPPDKSGTLTASDIPLGNIVINGDLPGKGTVIRFVTWKPLSNTDEFEFETKSANFDDKTSAKSRLDQISVFPNPYFGSQSLESNKYDHFVRFTNLPNDVKVRIYSLSGLFIRKLEKNSDSPWLDWDLKDYEGRRVTSGIYLANLEMIGIGTKILKLAVVQETNLYNPR